MEGIPRSETKRDDRNPARTVSTDFRSSALLRYASTRCAINPSRFTPRDYRNLCKNGHHVEFSGKILLEI